VIFAVITDGADFCPCKFGQAQVAKTIEDARRDGWQVVFIGANAGRAEAAALGLDPGSTAGFIANSAGVATAFAQLSSATADYRAGKTANVLMLPPGGSPPSQPAQPAGPPPSQSAVASVPETFEEWEQQQLRLAASRSAPETNR